MLNILKRIAAACLTGALLFLSHPPFSLWFVAYFALVPVLFIVNKKQNGWTTFLFGWLAGLTFHVLSLPWIENVVAGYSGLPAPLPFLLMLLLAAIMGSYLGIYALFVRHFKAKAPAPGYLWLAVVWVFVEWLKTWVLTGFPWNLLGYSQLPALPMVQIADIGGVFLVSFVVVCINLLVFQLLQAGAEWLKELRRPGFLAMLGIVVFTVGYGVVQLNLDYDGGSPFRATIIQDDLDNRGRWQLRWNEPLALYQYYEKETEKAVRSGSDVVIWGEGAFMYLDMIRENGGPAYRNNDFEELLIFSLVKDNGFWLLMGSNDYTDAGQTVYNTAITIQPDHGGTVTGRYAKQHLTPFGEYVPYTFIFGWLEKIVPEISDFDTGADSTPIPLKDGQVGVPLCYEVIFPDLVRQFVNNGAGILATLSNDAWFGRSAANQQHFNMAAMRAVENRRYMMRCAVSGISGFVHPSGRIMEQSTVYTRQSLTQTVSLMNGKTIYSTVGDIFVLICLLVVVLHFTLLHIRGETKKEK